MTLHCRFSIHSERAVSSTINNKKDLPVCLAVHRLLARTVHLARDVIIDLGCKSHGQGEARDTRMTCELQHVTEPFPREGFLEARSFKLFELVFIRRNGISPSAHNNGKVRKDCQ